jgi:hypothetical protein
MDLYNDLRLVPGVLGVVEHFAQSAGLAPEEQQNLIAATQQACLDTFKLLPGEDGRLGVSILGLPDRIEIVLEHRGEALPSAGLDTFAALAAGSTAESDFAGLELMARVDRVLYHTEGGSSRMTLVKYVSPHAGSPAPQR